MFSYSTGIFFESDTNPTVWHCSFKLRIGSVPRGGKSEAILRILFLINFSFVFYIIFIIMDLFSLKYPKLRPMLKASANVLPKGLQPPLYATRSILLPTIA